MITTEEYIKKAMMCHKENRYDYSLTIYKGQRKKIKIKCNRCGEFFEQKPDSHLRGGECVKCYGYDTLKFNQEEYIDKCKKIHGENRYDYSMVKYKNSRTHIRLKCNECGNIFDQNARSHSRGFGCRICANNKKLTTEEFIKKSKKIHGENRYDYSLSIYTNGRNKVLIKCNKCRHLFEVRAESHHRGQGCPRCNDSKGEKKISDFLKNKYINYEPQKRFKECRYKLPLPFDFYLPDYNMCIEYDGKQHSHNIFYFGGKIRENLYEELKIRDKIKDEYCNKNEIRLLRINYNENIIEKLEQYFN